MPPLLTEAELEELEEDDRQLELEDLELEELELDRHELEELELDLHELEELEEATAISPPPTSSNIVEVLLVWIAIYPA